MKLKINGIDYKNYQNMHIGKRFAVSSALLISAPAIGIVTMLIGVFSVVVIWASAICLVACPSLLSESSEGDQ